MDKRARIGTCSGPAEAALVRSVFDAHGIQVLIAAEHHASVLGGLGGAFLRLDILVDEADAEDAAALLVDIRRGDHAATDDDADDASAGAPADAARDEAEDARGVWGREDRPRPPPRASIVETVARRRSAVVAALLAAVPGFGAAHAYADAWFRAIFLGTVQVMALDRLIQVPPGGRRGVYVALLVGGRVLDAVGAALELARRPMAPRPR